VHVRAANSTAQDLSLRAYATMLRPDPPERERDAGYRLCEEALHIDPGNLIALIILSTKFSYRVFRGDSSDPQADIQRAEELASAALQIDPDAALGQAVKGDVLLAQARYREAIDAYGRCLQRNPSQVSVYSGLASAHCYLGEPELSIAEIAKAMRLSPLDPRSREFYFNNAQAYGVLQDYEQALVWARRATATAPRDHRFPLFLGLLTLAGHEGEAREIMRRYLAGNPPIRTISQWQRSRRPTDAPRFLLFRENYIAGLRKAGMPEE